RPPTTTLGPYTSDAAGTSSATATATGTRSLSVDVPVRPLQCPVGVFAHNVHNGGTGSIHYESEFSDSCIQGRQFINFLGTDAYYGIKSGAHAAGYTVEKQNDSCVASNSIHAAGTCNASYPYDSDFGAGSLASTTCNGAGGSFKGSPWLTTLRETSASAMA